MVAELGKHNKITGNERERLATELRLKYEKGSSIRELAQECGRSYGFVHRLLEEASTPLRGRGGLRKTTV